ncbi:Maf family protein [Brevibacillus fulvus]|uniref:dTTP/UTP pyrophosphatase n=1 Tax=Brevibacillus fulvus TaxID=1125967 RepID=A0A939BRU9_9BACL|nr:Maf family protein [Brevibacillus fulvus]MBM7590027.1 septum formation protein [Brevibacillus fulvus]
MEKAAEIILASSSPRRRELLETLKLPFTIMSSDVEETFSSSLTPAEVVEQLSLRKAREIAGKISSGIVIGADTIVVLDGNILGKPMDEDDAFRMLTALQGRTHTVYTGVALIEAATQAVQVAHSATQVKMRKMTDQEIRGYISTREPMDKAGSYAIQGFGATLVEEIQGDYFTVVGLPLQLTAKMLSQFGIRLF